MPVPTYSFAHVIGYFVFDEQFKIIDSGEERKMQKKYPNLVLINEQNICAYKNALLALKTPHYLAMFYDYNRTATKLTLKGVANNDNFIAQALACIDDIAKVREIFLHRIGEWCSLFSPEILKSKELLSVDLVANAEEAAPLNRLTQQVNDINKLGEAQFSYLKKIMNQHCPNLAAVAGYEIGGRMIVLAGSLEKLSRMASSKIQVLGAEKAFFRHLLEQTPLPKHGVIALHLLVKKSADEKKQNVARALAEKISIAVRVDYFKGEFVGNKLRKEVESI